MENYRKINLGCGKKIKEGYLNIDFIKAEGVDMVCDLNQYPWPFQDNTFDEVYASHFLEHLLDFKKTMEEIRRICRNKAKVTIRAPHFSCGVSFRDPTHQHFFSYFTFDYFVKMEYGLPKFKIVKRSLNFTREAFPFLNKFVNPVLNFNPAIYERLFCWIFPCAEILFTLEVEK